MKKIMFNDNYGLTEAVLSGRKTMTRRIVPEGILRIARLEVKEHSGDLKERIKDHTPICYQEVIAVAQTYKSIYDTIKERDGNCKAYEWWDELCDLRIGNGHRPAIAQGYRNKMFVLADLMPHRIRITNIKVERLQSISQSDIMREGIQEGNLKFCKYYYEEYGDEPKHHMFFNPQAAFRSLIDKVCKRGTWNRNPWVYAYTFELVQ